MNTNVVGRVCQTPNSIGTTDYTDDTDLGCTLPGLSEVEWAAGVLVSAASPKRRFILTTDEVQLAYNSAPLQKWERPQSRDYRDAKVPHTVINHIKNKAPGDLHLPAPILWGRIVGEVTSYRTGTRRNSRPPRGSGSGRSCSWSGCWSPC